MTFLRLKYFLHININVKYPLMFMHTKISLFHVTFEALLKDTCEHKNLKALQI